MIEPCQRNRLKNASPDLFAFFVTFVFCVLVMSLLSSCSSSTAGLSGAYSASSSAEGQSKSQNDDTILETNVVETATVIHVVDGDTLYVKRADGSNAKVRLIGIDCPESVADDESRNSAEGVQASDFTKSLVVEGSTIWMTRDVSDKDKYGRLLRYVWMEDPPAKADEAQISRTMLNAILVENGYAQAKNYEPDTACNEVFESLEKSAIEDGLGVSYRW